MSEDADPPRITVVSTEEAEKVDFVVCVREGTPTPFNDNLTGTCAHCGHAIVYRPYMPKRPTKICLECSLDLAKAGHA